ncbi:phosphatase PAP2 family protein [Lederbergia galactosidilytica]|uniref:Phosphatidic acid phosphatase type 2/haloperoxidase domain-containing protein n=1 Tax=Lederbergia galactosidilytica TaxID=217031 RepID=A0A177ZHH9_9BACI|nr:phosphatase PAP2 family protein [Lederbergia galactosidilytica]KRG13822.1 hypothetical protein ACA30_14045 [Virgibacillus soli]MBP1914115.1 undecaprenyl-diphosphatase [Lederbergia galactosidilytica]OAK67421.1 hypothetical protein ABB05_19955 [Lederbergia galactosidilytica]
MKWFLVILSLLLFVGLIFAFQIPLLIDFDLKILLFFEDIRTPFFDQFFTIITEIGSIRVLFPLCIGVSLYLVYKRCFLELVCLWTLFWGSRWLNFLLKEWVQRDRPSLHPLVEIKDYSFPSGHSMNSIAVLGFLFYLFMTTFKPKSNWKLFWILVTGITIFLIVISRLYLGVHYPTDVLAGLSLGYLLLVSLLYLFRVIRNKWLADSS